MVKNILIYVWSTVPLVFKMNGLALLTIAGEVQSIKLSHKEQNAKQQRSAAYILHLFNRCSLSTYHELCIPDDKYSKEPSSLC